jgi:hypothetical protein
LLFLLADNHEISHVAICSVQGRIHLTLLNPAHGSSRMLDPNTEYGVNSMLLLCPLRW